MQAQELRVSPSAVQADPNSVGRDRSCRIPRQAERLCNLPAKQRISESGEDEPQCRLGHMALVAPHAELCNQGANGLEDRIESLAVAREDHPGGKRARALPVEGIERAV